MTIFRSKRIISSLCTAIGFHPLIFSFQKLSWCRLLWRYWRRQHPTSKRVCPLSAKKQKFFKAERYSEPPWESHYLCDLIHSSMSPRLSSVISHANSISCWEIKIDRSIVPKNVLTLRKASKEISTQAMSFSRSWNHTGWRTVRAVVLTVTTMQLQKVISDYWSANG